MSTKIIGGYGHLAHGHHKYGAQDSNDFQYPTPQPIGPRFNGSRPQAGEYGVSVSQWITFEIYYYTSSYNVDPSLLPADLPIEISEDGGDTWSDATVAPYTITARPKDGQILWIKIVKDGDWTDNSKIMIRTTMPDEYGQPITGTVPVKWE
jgi:hypothetical protein